MNWEEHVYPDGICPINYEMCFSEDKKSHHLSIGPSKYTENLWYIWYYQGGYICIKETFEAKDLAAAKEWAINRIRGSIQRTIGYYQRLLNEIDEKAVAANENM